MWLIPENSMFKNTGNLQSDKLAMGRAEIVGAMQ